MANRNNTFLIKRSNVPGKIPTIGQMLLGEISLNTADAIIYTSGTTQNSILPIGWDRVYKTGDTMSGPLYSPTISATTIRTSGAYLNNNGITASTISATTYQNLPNTTFTGGTVSGATIFKNGLTANTFSATSINKVDYIVFNTGTTSASTSAGTIYFDNVEKSLSYNTSINQNVTVNLGQQNYLRVFNNSGFDIARGKALEILSASNGLPSVTLALNKNIGFNIVGVSSEIIPNNSEGIVITNGIISNIEITGTSVGSLVYASDSIAGNIDSAVKYLNFPLTARTNSVGYVVQTGSTTGKLFVNIQNENNILTFTDLQREILEGNAVSTGVFSFNGISLSTGTTFNVGQAQGWIVDNTTNFLKPTATYVNYSGGTNLTTPYLSSSTETYIMLTSASTISLINSFPTPKQRRQNIYLGKLGHANKTTLNNVFNEPDSDISPLSQLRDVMTPIKLINSGVVPSANGANLFFNTSFGTLWGLGVGFTNNLLNPNSLDISANTITSFQYRTQTGGTSSNTTNISPSLYDLNGVITTIGSPAKQATNQRIYMLQNGLFRIQYGQTVYLDLPTAISQAQTEIFNTFVNFKDNAILVGILSLRSDTTNLSDTAYAKFLFVSKFGELGGGTGGISTTSLQQAYNNSTVPLIVTNSILGGFTIQNGSGVSDNVSNLYSGFNTAGQLTSFITASGGLSATTISATTISATTYQNLPSQYRTSILTSGSVYSFTNFNSINTLSINKTVGSITTVNLNQTPSINEFYVVKDRKGDSNTNPITVSGGSYTIDGASTLIINQINKPSFTFMFDGEEYIII